MNPRTPRRTRLRPEESTTSTAAGAAGATGPRGERRMRAVAGATAGVRGSAVPQISSVESGVWETLTAWRDADPLAQGARRKVYAILMLFAVLLAAMVWLGGQVRTRGYEVARVIRLNAMLEQEAAELKPRLTVMLRPERRLQRVRDLGMDYPSHRQAVHVYGRP